MGLFSRATIALFLLLAMLAMESQADKLTPSCYGDFILLYSRTPYIVAGGSLGPPSKECCSDMKALNVVVCVMD